MRDRYDAIVLMGPPGSGKSFLGCELAEQGLASFVELEPQLRREFSSGAALGARMLEVATFLWRAYREQIRESALTVAFESSGVGDRRLLESLRASYRVALVHVSAARALCIERLLVRAAEQRLLRTADGDAIGHLYDVWQQQIAPTYAFDLAVDGADVDDASAGIRNFLECPES